MDKKIHYASWTIFVLLIITGITLFVTANNSIISISQKEYSVGDLIDIQLNIQKMDNVYVDILTPSSVYKFLNPQNIVKYRPTEPGIYRVNIFNDNGLIESKSFIVKGEKILQQNYFTLDKLNYVVGEDVIIKFNTSLIEDSYKISIKYSEKEFNYLTDLKNELRFVPKQEGKYEINLYDGQRNIFSMEFTVCNFCQTSENSQFNLTENNTIQNISQKNEFNFSTESVIDVLNSDIKTLDIKNSQGYISKIRYEIKNIQNITSQNITNQTSLKQGEILGTNSLNKETADITLYPDFSGIKNLEFKNLEYENFDLGFEAISEKTVFIPSVNIKKIFAIDPSNLIFDSANMEIEAKGNQLLKCAEWNFEKQYCDGEWKFQKYIEPGKDYSIIITPTDPAFVEVGLASINTEKSIYHNFDLVKFMIVVLDKSGYLVNNADINLQIQTPNSNTFSFSTNAGNIVEVSRGVYEGNFTETAFSGRYDLFVEAVGDLVNNSMYSYFDVANYYEFEINRDAPVTIDPFNELMECSINIFSYSGIDDFTYTENVPESFEIVESEADLILSVNGTRKLTWYNLNNNSTIDYKAQLPETSPELYELQGLISYENSTYLEPRPWFVAADPSSSYYVSMASCAGWGDTTCCPGGSDRGECPSSGSTTYTCTYTDTADLSLVPVSVNVTVLDIWTVMTNNIDVRINGQTVGQTGMYGAACANQGTSTGVLTDLSQYNVGAANTVSLVPQAAGIHLVSDSSGTGVFRIDVAYTQAPQVNLELPEDGYSIERGYINFSFNVTDDDLYMQNCSMWNDFEGSWSSGSTTGILGETGSVDIENFEWHWISFNKQYDVPPIVIATPVTQNGAVGEDDSPLIPTINEVTTSGFNITICQDNGAVTCDPTVALETLHYFVFDVNETNKYDWIDVGTVTTTTAGADTTLNFGKTFSNKPVVWTTPQTYNQAGNIAAHVWVEDDATKTTSSTPIIGCVHQGIANACTAGQPDEEVGYVAIDIANVNISGFQSGNADISNSAWTAATFDPLYINPRVMVTQNDDDGGEDPEYPWAKDVTTSGMDFRFCEADAADVCNTHTSEVVDWFALEQGYITLPGKTLQTVYDIENATTINMTFYISPGEYTWGAQCFDINGAEGWSENRTLFVTKPIDMFYPDRAAPGMNFIMTIIGEEFNIYDTIKTDSSDIVIGKISIYNKTGYNTEFNGYVIQVPFFINENAANQNVTFNISRAIPPWNFEIITPLHNSGNFSGQTGSKTLGNGGSEGERSFFGTILLDKLIVPNGLTISVSRTDPDNDITNGNQGYFPAIILVDGIVNISGNIDIQGFDAALPYLDQGGEGGAGGPGGAGGGGGGSDGRDGGDGGDGYTGGGSGGVDQDPTYAGGTSGDGTGGQGSTGDSADGNGEKGGVGFSDKPIGGGGGLGSSDDGAGAGGGVGFIFGTSGEGGGNSGASGTSGSGGGGGSSDDNYDGGGAGFGSPGTDGTSPVAAGTGGSVYGSSQLVPLAGGSGGGGGGVDSDGGDDDGAGAGGGGGGSLTIFSSKLIEFRGIINATGGDGSDCNDELDCGLGGGGSGGSVILQAPYVDISGIVDATGGLGSRGAGLDGQGGDGGSGRIRVDGSQDFTSFGLTTDFEGTNFTGPAIFNISDGYINGTATPDTEVSIVVLTQAGSYLYYNATVDSNGWFTYDLLLPNGWNYVTIIQNTSTNQISMMSSPALTTFLAGAVPRITDVDCMINSVWLDCSNALYGTSLQEVRAQCTVSGASISNVSFELKNIPDDQTYFSALTTDNTTVSGWWWHNNANIDVDDSGYWNLEVTCSANNSVYTTQNVQWLVPWGTLSSSQLDPTTDKDAAQNSTFDWSTQLSCIGGECGDLNATLSLFSYWWNSSWPHKQRFNITHTAENVTEYQLMIYMNTESLISQGKMQNDCSDIRAISSDYQEIPFFIDEATGITCGTKNTLIWVQVPRIDSNVTNYFEIYYGNMVAESKSNIHDVFSYSEQKEIYFLVSENTDTAMAIISYEDDNMVTSNFNTETVVIDEGEVSIDFIATDVNVGYSFSVTGAILSAATTVGTADVLSPISWAGTEFYDYKLRGGANKEWFVYAPFAEATIDFWSGASAAASFAHLNTSIVGKRQWYKVTTADGTDGDSFKINSSSPILLAYEQGTGDVTIQHPATTDLWGIDGGDFVVGYDTTRYSLYDSDAATLSRVVDETDQVLTTSVSQGAGSALHMNATNLIGASATADSDGGDTFVFLPEYELESQYYIPVTGQYISGAATNAVSCTVEDSLGKYGLNENDNRTYPIPSKICFGAQCTGSGITADKTNYFTDYANITCSVPFFAYYDDDDDDETNIYGRKSARQYIWPEPQITENAEQTYTAAVNTTPGALPFWTSSYNAISPTQDPCLRNMAAGATCVLDWVVNATGSINTTWEFFVDFLPFEYRNYIPSHEADRHNVTIVDIVRPQVTNLECYQNATTWVDCSLIAFNEEIAAVRAKCSYDFSNPVVNMTFKLDNLDDTKTYFENTTLDNSTGYWRVNLTNQIIVDSGMFDLRADCYVDNGINGYGLTEWYIPYGIIGISWYNPDSNVSVTQFELSDFSVEVTCSNGECLNQTAVLDPLPVPFTLVFMDFESGTEFEMYTGGNGECTNRANVCSFSQYWDDFSTCTESESSGLCVSPESAVSGSFGLLAQGSLDRQDVSNTNDSLMIYINDTACGGNPCEEINISFWQSVASMDASTEGSAVFVNDSTGTWILIEDCMEGEICNDDGNDLAAADMSSVAEYVSMDICDLGVDCNDNLTIRFTSKEIRSHGNADWFGWDNVNITGYITKGVIPENSGNPFYTINSNPMTWTDDNCLENMSSGDSCIITWSVNATGPLGSKHEFFSILNSSKSYNNETQSSIIYVTIVDNLIPVVSDISLTPLGPTSTDDLYCNFTIHDDNFFDTLSVNVSWYKDGVLDISGIYSVGNDAPYSVKLGSGNTSLGEIWHCGVLPYDQKTYGAQINSSSVQILLSYPPIVTDIECLEGAVWGDCSNLLYKDSLLSVRANCTDSDGTVINATFNLTNIPDNYLFFSNTTTSGTDIYTFDNDNVWMQDSGFFNLTVECIDDFGVSGYGHSDWFVPFGTLQANFEKPQIDINMTQNIVGEFRANITCIGGECGNITAILDPEGSWPIAYMDFETGTEFVLDPNACDTTGLAYCDDSEFWDDFESCQDPEGGYGICSSPYMAVDGSRGLEFLGVDQNDVGNDGGLYLEIDASTACNGYVCEQINVSYYQAVGNLNVGVPEEGSAVFVNGSDSIKYLVSECMESDSCAGSAASMWSVAEYVNVDLCSISGVDCSESLTLHFTSRYARAHGTGDYFGWDTINVTGYGIKGVIPMNNGVPFYTSNQNPVSSAFDSCLYDMDEGDNCTIIWYVNATGTINTTHEVFAYFNASQYETYITKTETDRLDITIIENQPPFVTYINIGPEYPLNTTDLICNFTVHDPGYYDNLTVNITWYKNNVANNYSNMSVIQDTVYEDSINSQNTEVGEDWHCGVKVFDGYVWGPETNSSNVTILLFPPPEINEVECYVDETWGVCSDVDYHEVLDAVRVDCTSAEGMVNATFNLTNEQDNFNYYVQMNTSFDGTYFILNHTDINITDSGNWLLDVYCIDNATQIARDLVNWTVPWGILTTSLVSPDSDTNVEYHKFFTFEAEVSCTGGECGNATATLDPYIKMSNYNFLTGYQVDKFARAIDSNDNPPTSINYGQTYDLSLAQVNQINVSDDIRFATAASGSGDYASVEVSFTINENIGDITNLSLLFHGQPDQTNDMQIYAWNINTNIWDLLVSQVIPADTDRDMIGVIDSGISNYVNSSNQIKWVIVDDFTNSLMRTDYVEMNVTYDAYKGILSTVQGTIPFYTTDDNPKDWTNQSCLANLTSGDICSVEWNINTTGPIGSTHEFFVYANATKYSYYIPGDESTHIFIKITNESNVPPIVILEEPANGTFSNDFPVLFNCSATDNSGLKNMTLYADFNGTFMANETINVTGAQNSTVFSKELVDGRYLWNCLGYDIDGNFDWGANNRTLIFDTGKPGITLYYPDEGSSLTDSAVIFNFSVIDAYSDYVTCDLYFDEELTQSGIDVDNNTVKELVLTEVEVDQHEWYIYCVDRAGNANETAPVSFEVIDLPPNVTLVTANNTFFNTPNITLQYIPEDNRGINNSQLIINNVVNQTKYDPPLGDVNEFNVTNLEEGYYYWTVNVTDNYNLSYVAKTRRFVIDYNPPNITLVDPSGDISSSNSEVNITFYTIDNLDEIMTCNITVNGVVRDIEFDVDNNTQITRNISNMPDGKNYWNITCWDGALNYNTSATYEIEVGEPPFVQLDLPASGSSQKQQEVNLYYTPTDNTGFAKCDLFLNGIFNKTNSSGILNNQQNLFTLDGTLEGFYEWRINCTDLYNLSTMSETWNFTVDYTQPDINLLRPQPDELWLGRRTNFNFSVIDNLDPDLVCNITVDGVVNVEAQNIIAYNNTPTNQSVQVPNEGYHYWNVTCVDTAGNQNISETWRYETKNPPEVTLVFPAEGDVLNYNDITFEYVPLDEDLNTSYLWINGVLNQTNDTITSEEYSYFDVLDMADGVWNWTINVTDDSNLSIKPDVITFTIDTTAPVVTLNHPFNLETIDWNNVTFNFTVYDNLASDLICNVTINGTIEEVNLSVSNNSETILYKAFYDGGYNWSVTCADEAFNSDNSFVEFTVDAPPLVTLITPTNETRTASQDITFEYLPEDIYGIENCTLFLDDLETKNSTTVNNNEQNSFDVYSISEGLHNWTVECVDKEPDYNTYSPEPYFFRIDISGPTIVLNFPGIDDTLNLNNVTFNYTAYETDQVVIDCNITVSDFFGERINATSEPSGIPHIIRIDNLSDGEHFWNVTCVDDLGNLNTSETQRFVINQPDLETDDTKVTLSNFNPTLGENITIWINVSNIGGQPADNAVVAFFDGNPGSGGLFIGNDTKNVAINSSEIFQTTWIVTQGYHLIYISADPQNQKAELNETNNNATIFISALWANITSPLNNSWWNTPEKEFIINMTDYTGNNIDYEVYVDTLFNGEFGTGQDGILQLQNITFVEGTHDVYIKVNDSLNRVKYSPGIEINIDLTDPEAVFGTVDGSWFNYSQPEIMFTITDNMDNEINYTFFIDGAPSFTASALDSIQQIINLPVLTTGQYELIIEARDEAGNRKNSTPLTITVDLVEPTILLISPDDVAAIFVNYTTLNYSVRDNYDDGTKTARYISRRG